MLNVTQFIEFAAALDKIMKEHQRCSECEFMSMTELSI